MALQCRAESLLDAVALALDKSTRARLGCKIVAPTTSAAVRRIMEGRVRLEQRAGKRECGIEE